VAHMPGNPVAPSTEVGFEVVRRGYDQGEVDTHLRTLDAHISILVADRNAALEQAGQLARELDESRVRAEKLRAQVRTLVSPGQNVQGMSERMRAMLRLAQDEVTEMLSGAATEVTRRITESEGQATQIVAAAKAEAESTLNAARTEAETTLTAARTEADTTLNAARTEAETTVSAAKADAGATLGAATAESERLTQELARARAEFDVERRTSQEQLAAERREVEQMLAAELEKAEQERARAWAESETRRTVAEEDFTLALDQRRSEALAAIAAERTEAHRQSEELRELAAQRFREEEARAKEMGRAVVGDAEQRFGELIELRKRISEQLSDARVVLDRTLEKMTATPERTSAEPAKSDSRALPSQREFAAGGALATGEAGSGDADETDTQTNGSRRPRPRPRPQAAAGRR
jgi:vacuolar-type H+-ATPase subunit H